MAHDIGEWLEGLGLGKYVKAFVENGIDLRTLPHLSEDDLKEFGCLAGTPSDFAGRYRIPSRSRARTAGRGAGFRAVVAR